MKRVTILGVAAMMLLVSGCTSNAGVFGTHADANGERASIIADRSEATSPDATAAKIYAVNEPTNQVTAYKVLATGNVNPAFHISGPNTGLASPIGDDFDSAGQLYVLNAGSPPSFEVFVAGARGDIFPKYFVQGALTQLNNPQGIAVDPTGITYVTNSTGGQSYITVYAAGSNNDRAPIATIYDAVNFFFIPSGIAVFNGTLYVADQGDQSINEYPANGNGLVNPTAVILGLSTPRGVAIDTQGRIYVTDSDRILVYAANANGNVPPLRTISGSLTQLSGAAGLVVRKGSIFVADSGSSAITVYPQTGNGNIAPTRSISGGNTLLNSPQDLAIH